MSNRKTCSSSHTWADHLSHAVYRVVAILVLGYWEGKVGEVIAVIGPTSVGVKASFEFTHSSSNAGLLWARGTVIVPFVVIWV